MSRRYEQGTSTSNFGVGGRESHDASAFYSRFPPKHLSSDDTLSEPFTLAEPLVCGDSRAMELPDNSVALVVTSPPYFAGKEYEEALGQGAIPATYAAYLELLSEVFRDAGGFSSRADGSPSTWPTWVADRTVRSPPTSFGYLTTTSECCSGGRSSGRRRPERRGRAHGARTARRPTLCCAM